jgi:ABC-type phosphate transport system substrate-binding protein
MPHKRSLALRGVNAQAPGHGTAVERPTGVGAKGNEGTAGNVSQTKNSIGYVGAQLKWAHDTFVT